MSATARHVTARSCGERRSPARRGRSFAAADPMFPPRYLRRKLGFCGLSDKAHLRMTAAPTKLFARFCEKMAGSPSQSRHALVHSARTQGPFAQVAFSGSFVGDRSALDSVAKFVSGCFCKGAQQFIAGWSSPVARQAHNLKVIGSNPIPATRFDSYISVLARLWRAFSCDEPLGALPCLIQLKSR